MLPKINRLTKKKDFELVFKNGEVLKEGSLLFKTAKNNQLDSRFGFVVSKKISNKATIRNKVKRRLRRVVSSHLSEFKKPFDVIVIALLGIQKQEISEIEMAVVKFIKKNK